MTQLTLEMPESAFSVLHQAPKEFAQEMRVAAAVKWYELGRLSQGRAAEIADLTRAGFINALSRYQVSPFLCRAYPAYSHKYPHKHPHNGLFGRVPLKFLG